MKQALQHIVIKDQHAAEMDLLIGQTKPLPKICTNLLNQFISTQRLVRLENTHAKANLISVNSPIARAMVGKMEGDEVVVNAPGGDVIFEIDTVAHLSST